jgi:glycosyltransferase involved in cell wall biosynthesis
MNNMEITLSVCVTFCNQKKFVSDAMRSILMQKTAFNYEVLIGLDGPENNQRKESRDLINQYMKKHPFIKLVEIRQPDGELPNIAKACYNRTELIKMARGKYICFLDGDDFYIDDNFFNFSVAALEMSKNSIGCVGGFNTFNDKTKTYFTCSRRDQYNYFNRRMVDNLINNEYSHLGCGIFRNLFLLGLPGDFDTLFANDTELMLYFLKYGSLFVYNQHVYGYRILDDSIWTGQSENAKLFESAIIHHVVNHMVAPEYGPEIIRKMNACQLNVKHLFEKYQSVFSEVSRSGLLEKWNKIPCIANNYFIKSFTEYDAMGQLQRDEVWRNIHKLETDLISSNMVKPVSMYWFDDWPNFGDMLNKYIFTNVKRWNVRKADWKEAKYMGIGSIIQGIKSGRSLFHDKIFHSKTRKYRRMPLHIISSGYIDNNPIVNFGRIPIPHILRGKLSLSNLERDTGQKYPECKFGDMGLLAKYLVPKENIPEKKYKIGIIAHAHERLSDKLVHNINMSSYTIIDIQENPIYVIQRILECECILSSALHGLIVADSFGIPNKRMILDNLVNGGDFKFEDYYSALDMKPPMPFVFKSGQIITDILPRQIITDYCVPKKKVQKIQQDLLDFELPE